MAEATVQAAARISPTMHRELVAIAKKCGTSLNYEINVALRAHIDASKKGARP